jgi:membrane-bound lytic murein transglycosylase B
MRKMTAMAAALAAAFTSFAANAQPQASKSSKVMEKVSVASAVDGTDDAIGLPGVQGFSSTLHLEASHGVKAPRKHSKHRAHRHASGKSTKRAKIALNSRRGVGTMSVAANAAAATPQLAKAQYSTIVSRYAAAYGVPAELAHAVIKVESNYRANARGGAGEIGLMQIKPSTARMMGYNGNANGLFNPETNIKYGMKYLAKAHSLGGGSTCGTILKYNAGHGATRMNPVSAAYCSKVKQQLAMN